MQINETPIPFEEGMEQLESLVARMEDGDLPLERMLADYEQGMALLGGLEAQLKDARARVEILRQAQAGGGLEAAAFEVDDEL